MSEALLPVSGFTPYDGIEGTSAARKTADPTANFATWFASEMQSVNSSLLASERGLQELAAGGSVSLHEVMMRTEEARLSFNLLVQVRNRVLEAYQEVMRMQG